MKPSHKVPSLLRNADFFNNFSPEASTVSKRFPHYGTNAPAVPRLGDTATSRFTFYLLRQSPKTLLGKVREMVCRVMRQRRADNGRTARAPLMALPDELLLQVMCYLPASSLYCLRQTSTRFMVLFNTREFAKFHQVYASSPSSNYKGFDVDILGAAELNATANSLHHDKYCASCLAAEESGTLDDRLEALRTLRYCYGCPQPRACTNLSHKPKWSDGNVVGFAGSAFAWLLAAHGAINPSVFEIGNGWHLPLLETGLYNYTLPPVNVQHAISSKVQNAINTNCLCPHISADKEIKKFVQFSICKCFINESITFGNRFENCKCERHVILHCRICRAIFTWRNRRGVLVLSFQHMRRVQRPMRPAWPSLIDKEFNEKLFTKENQHVLWCETLNCRTNTRRRWEALVQDNSEREYLNATDEDVINSFYYLEAYFSSHEGSFQNW